MADPKLCYKAGLDGGVSECGRLRLRPEHRPTGRQRPGQSHRGNLALAGGSQSRTVYQQPADSAFGRQSLDQMASDFVGHTQRIGGAGGVGPRREREGREGFPVVETWAPPSNFLWKRVEKSGNEWN